MAIKTQNIFCELSYIFSGSKKFSVHLPITFPDQIDDLMKEDKLLFGKNDGQKYKIIDNKLNPIHSNERSASKIIRRKFKEQ